MKPSKSQALFLMFLTLSGCASSGHRDPASAKVELRVLAANDLLYVNSTGYTDAACPAYLADLTARMKALPWDNYTNEELTQEGPALIQDLWNIRLKLHASLPSVGKDCALAMRTAFVAIRSVEDYLGDFVYHEAQMDPSTMNFETQPIPIDNRSAYAPYLVVPSLDPGQNQPFHFQSGDLMMARGVSFISAVISKVSDDQSQFSHIVFVDVDPKTAKETTIESYIGVGVEQYQMDYALRNENARLLVLRPKNKALGEKAAELLLAKTLAGNGHGGNIPYDYQMESVDHKTMSCAETARAAYQWASDGQVMIPAYQATIPDQNPKFLKDASIPVGQLVTPGDLETDPNFELVLDWRDYRILRDSRYKDAILTDIMRWVNQLQYNFQGNLSSFFAGDILLPSRSTFLWPLLKKISGAPQLDPTMPTAMLKSMTTLNDVGAILLKQVREADQKYIIEHQRPMTDQQLITLIEGIRVSDLTDFVTSGHSTFTWEFHPDNVHAPDPNNDE